MIRSSMQLPSWRSLPVPGVTAFQAQSGRICVPLWIQEWLPDGPDTAVGLALAPVQAPEPQWNEALVMWVCEFHLYTGSESGVGQSSQFFSNLLHLPFLDLPVSRGFTSCIERNHMHQACRYLPYKLTVFKFLFGQNQSGIKDGPMPFNHFPSCPCLPFASSSACSSGRAAAVAAEREREATLRLDGG